MDFDSPESISLIYDVGTSLAESSRWIKLWWECSLNSPVTLSSIPILQFSDNVDSKGLEIIVQQVLECDWAWYVLTDSESSD